MITPHVKHYQGGTCEGVACCTSEAGACLWVEYTHIERLTQADAMSDARNLCASINSINQEVTQ